MGAQGVNNNSNDITLAEKLCVCPLTQPFVGIGTILSNVIKFVNDFVQEYRENKIIDAALGKGAAKALASDGTAKILATDMLSHSSSSPLDPSTQQLILDRVNNVPTQNKIRHFAYIFIGIGRSVPILSSLHYGYKWYDATHSVE